MEVIQEKPKQAMTEEKVYVSPTKPKKIIKKEIDLQVMQIEKKTHSMNVNEILMNCENVP